MRSGLAAGSRVLALGVSAAEGFAIRIAGGRWTLLIELVVLSLLTEKLVSVAGLGSRLRSADRDASTAASERGMP